MKIAILIPTLNKYGAEKVTARFANGFVKNNCDVTVILSDASSPIEIKGATVVSIFNSKGLNQFYKILYAPIQYFYLLKRIRSKKYDVIISIEERAGFFNLLLPGKHKKILTVHSFLDVSLKERPLINLLCINFIYGHFINRADLIVCVSKAIAEDFIKKFPINPKKVLTIYNPTNVDEIKNLSKKQLDKTHEQLFEGKTLLNVGRFTRDKGQWHLLRAFMKVLNHIDDVKLIILGDGPLKSYLENLAKELGISNNIYFLGFQQNPFSFLSKATLVVSSSLWEGFPTVLVEALCCQSPIISTDCKSGPRELLAPNTDYSKVAENIEECEYGILVPPIDGKYRNAKEKLTKAESMLATGILKTLSDDSLRQKYKGKSIQRVESLKTERIVREWLRILEPTKSNLID